ncbi:guanylate cyclase [Caerostris extrusa]|uniref:Guanylate cyclase n=1 Tax=Caerostris extrusa TaxID=172846 RepID=A0AAV4MK37_CAEEX|nr:guanylate cyclase [Caerostris extrusa]
MIYASALTQALAHNVSEINGSAVFQYIKSRPYESILGFSVMIDDQGDAEGNYTVMALVEVDDALHSQKMRPVARFNYQGSNGLPSLRLERPINWISGSPPRSEPPCGFTGRKMRYQTGMEDDIDLRCMLCCQSCWRNVYISSLSDMNKS